MHFLIMQLQRGVAKRGDRVSKIACNLLRDRIEITTNVPFLLGSGSFQLTESYAIYITFTAKAGAHYGNECREGHGESESQKRLMVTRCIVAPVQWTLAQFDIRDTPAVCVCLVCEHHQIVIRVSLCNDRTL